MLLSGQSPALWIHLATQTLPIKTKFGYHLIMLEKMIRVQRSSLKNHAHIHFCLFLVLGFDLCRQELLIICAHTMVQSYHFGSIIHSVKDLYHPHSPPYTRSALHSTLAKLPQSIVRNARNQVTSPQLKKYTQQQHLKCCFKGVFTILSYLCLLFM